MLATLVLSLAVVAAEPPFAIRVIDAETKRGVPLVELTTTNHLRFVTDSAGYVAFDEPGLFGQKVFFNVKSHGYVFPKDGFGFEGKALDVVPGGSATLEIQRVNIAQRLYRVIGGGIYADSIKLGKPVPIKAPLLNAQVFGSDSVVNVQHGKDYLWFWGDTNRPRYPLGQFHVPSARSKLPENGGLDPDLGVDLMYLVDQEGFAKKTAELPGQGPTWIGAALMIPERSGGPEKLVAAYVKVRNFLDVYEHGVAVWDDASETFKGSVKHQEKAPIYPNGHAEIRNIDGTSHVYFDTPFPLTRVRPDLASYQDLSGYEGFTPLAAGTTIDQGKIERDSKGEIVYGWKANTPPLGPADEAKLIKSGALKDNEARVRLRDEETGRVVIAHGGNIAWNPYRQRWVLIAVEAGGVTSYLGEVWYAESDSLVGPWCYARKVVTHDRYSFYNPKQHSVFAKEGGKILYFEGTYCTTFSGNNDPTPRYDYNQIMYKLDLWDPRLNLPAPVVEVHESGKTTYRLIRQTRLAMGFPAARTPAFFAKDRPGSGLVAFVQGKGIVEKPKPGEDVLFYGIRPNGQKVPATMIPLFVRADGSLSTLAEGTARPSILVWKSPTRLTMAPDRIGTGPR